MHNLQPAYTDNKRRFAGEEDSNAERKTWKMHCFENRNLLRLDLNESIDGFLLTERGRSFHNIQGPKTGKAAGTNREKYGATEVSRG